MEVVGLGHAGLRIVGVSTTGLIDPWLTTEGAFLGSWHQLPANDFLATPEVLAPDWVAVSHDHQDHLDLETLARVPAGTPVYIPAYPAPRLRELLCRHTSLRPVEVPAGERIVLDDRGSWLTFVPETSPMCHDAAVLLSVDGVSVLDCNDARITPAQARSITRTLGRAVDVMTVQTSGASWHPICYGYPDDAMRAISARKRGAKLRGVATLIAAAAPRVAIPFAGPPCFLDPAVAHHNRWIEPPGIFPHAQATAAVLRKALPGQDVLPMLPGDCYLPEAGVLVREPRWDGFSFERLGPYLHDYAYTRAVSLSRMHARHPEPDDTLGLRFADHFAALGELSPWFLERIDMTVRFDVEGPGGGRWDVHLRPGGVRVDLDGGARDTQYGFRLASRWLAPVVDGDIGWEDLLLSLRFSAWRSPDLYNDYFIGWLKHADARALQAVEDYERARDAQTTIRVQGSKGEYEIGRFCPHAGEDLSENGVVVGNRICCLGHNYEFDLETGECSNGRCTPLATQALESLGPSAGV
jgi:UDP-MurNAc hydroxylase